MTLDEATRLLTAARAINDQSLTDFAPSREIVRWAPGNTYAKLHGVFTADDLEAIAIWMRAHTPPEEHT